MVPLTLKCLGTYQNGVWLTISSLLVWIDQMDIGLGSGLRNSLTAHIAHQEIIEARKVVSSCIAMLICVVIPIILLLLLVINILDIYSFLNVNPNLVPELRVAFSSAVILVSLTFVLKSVSNIYMAMQLPAVSNLLISIGQTLALICTYLLFVSGQSTFLAIVIINTAAPLLVYLLSFPITFYYKFPFLRPSFRFANLHSAIELGNLGLKFFWLQIASILQFWTANLLISKFFSPAMVTPYQIASRYLGTAMIIFTIICMPYWNATTDAYERKDIKWIRDANQKMNLMSVGCALLLVLMVLLSPWVYSLWIGDSCHVPFGITLMMAIYIYLMIFSMRYSYFLNGIGALRIQLYMTFMTVIFIPLSYIVSHITHNILWFMAVMCVCNVPGIVANAIQFNKILSGKATGVWRI